MRLKPIVFILGLSGIGKTSTSDALKIKCGLCHINMDRSKAFKRIGLPNEWDTNIEGVDLAVLADHVRSRLKHENRGAVLSFPTIYRFTQKQLYSAAAHGIGVVILWGAFECSAMARRERQEARGKGTPSASRYERLNKPTFDIYSRGEYECFRVRTFNANCSRRPFEAILADIAACIADQGLHLSQEINIG